EFRVAADWSVTTPSWRPDVFGAVDVIEEIARIRGLDVIPAVSVTKDASIAKSAETPRGAKSRKCRTALAASGLQECVTYSFMKEDLAEIFGANDHQNAPRLKLLNAISVDLTQMRPSILPNLIEAASRNADKGLYNTAFFEVGPIFYGTDLNEQPVVASGIRMGAVGARHWSGPAVSRAVDAYDAKADVLRALEACGGVIASVQVSRDAPRWYHPGRSGTLRMGNTVIAHFGEIHPAVLNQMKITAPVVGFELFIENVPEQKRKGTAKSLLELSPFQPVSRDFAFLADANIDADAFVKTIKAADRNVISAVEIFDIYTGKGIDTGKKSVAIAVTLQPKDHTLTEAEIDGISQKIVALVEQKTGAVLRS
ncbi:MAG: phenylalanine--tRNA ligase subunit beta, partial [Pseudomonadota bacterium]